MLSVALPRGCHLFFELYLPPAPANYYSHTDADLHSKAPLQWLELSRKTNKAVQLSTFVWASQGPWGFLIEWGETSQFKLLKKRNNKQ